MVRRILITEATILVCMAGALAWFVRPHPLSTAPGVQLTTIDYRCNDNVGDCVDPTAYDPRSRMLLGLASGVGPIVGFNHKGKLIPGKSTPKTGCALTDYPSHLESCGYNSVAIDPRDSSLVVSEGKYPWAGSSDIRRIAMSGAVSVIVHTDASAPCEQFTYALDHLCHPKMIAVDPTSGTIYFVQGEALMRVDHRGHVSLVAGADPLGWDDAGCLGHDGSGSSAVFCDIGGIAVRVDGSILVTESENDVVDTVSPNGESHVLAGSRRVTQLGDLETQPEYYQGKMGSDGTNVLTPLYSLFYYGHPLCYSQDGKGASARFCGPVAVGVDLRSGDAFVDDEGSQSVRKVDPSGNVTTAIASSVDHGCVVVGETKDNPFFCSPRFLWADERSHTLYIVDNTDIEDGYRFTQVTLP